MNERTRIPMINEKRNHFALNAELLNSITTDLKPITQTYWEDMHVWPYEQIASRLKEDHIVDVGAGCGLLSIYLVHNNYVKTAEMWDGRSTQIEYAQELVKALDLQDRIKVNKEYAYPDYFRNKTILAIRYGSLLEFEKYHYTNRLITLRRTNEVDLYFNRESTLPWSKEIITRRDGFELEYLEFDYHKTLKIVLNGERWMETIKPELLLKLKHNSQEIEGIGRDWMEQLS